MPRFLNSVLLAATNFSLFSVLFSATAFGAEVEFSRDIRPILSDVCFQCHGPDEEHREADLRFDDQENVLMDRGDYAVVVAGSRDSSELWKRITSDDPDVVMPPADHSKQLTPSQIELIGKWIDEGAVFQGHWSFNPPRSPAPPTVSDDRFAGTAIDRFVYSMMRSKGLSPSPPATKETLLRRVTLDLTGLPPTLKEVDEFLSDNSPDAYERVVDRLLDSVHYGERMALDWMDAARYGDSSVFHADGPRDMWVWREWVIDAFNDNMPFDQFTIEQLAGDLLPNPTWRQLVATGFNRNNATTDEGGLIEEEYRVEYAIDRVKTTSLVWLGLSMECGQCHDHKFDPITQEDYYRFFAFFNQAADPGRQTRNGNQAPIVSVPDERLVHQVPELQKKRADLTRRLDRIQSDSGRAFTTWLDAKRATLSNESPTEEGLVAHFPLDAVDQGQLINRVSENPAKLNGQPSSIVEGHFLDGLTVDDKTFAQASDVGGFERNQPFSISCWVKPEKVEGAPLAKMDSDNQSRGYDVHLRPGAVEVHLIHSWPDNAIKIEAKADVKPGQWQHVAVTYDGSSKAGGIRVYLNGSLVETKIVADKLTDSIRTKKPFTIGRRSNGSVFRGVVDDVRLYNRPLPHEEVKSLADHDSLQTLVKAAEENDRYRQRLRQWYLDHEHADYRQTKDAIEDIDKAIAECKKPRSTVMVMKNVPKMRPTYVLKRGQYDAPDQDRPVEPGVPRFLRQIKSDEPATRLDLAKWIVDRQNPLTARVIVNRYWRLLMGTGIVRTVEEFGAQGEWPSHPRLLDWLAVDFMEHGWDVKRLMKQIVMTETYRQSSKSNPQQLTKDRENRYLSRGPRFRLQGEFIRDNALAISGLLVDKVGGPSVKPYQPSGIWNEVSLNGNLRYRRDSGENLYRRSMYTYWKRSAPSPSMTIFDAPTREKCTVRRSTTNTPLQALVVMNDPQFMEAARFLAERIMREAATTEQRIEHAYRLATARSPSPKVANILLQAFESERAAFENDPSRAKKLLSVGEKKRDESLDAIEHAAWTVVASILLNLDETLTRG